MIPNLSVVWVVAGAVDVVSTGTVDVVLAPTAAPEQDDPQLPTPTMLALTCGPFPALMAWMDLLVAGS